MIATLYAPEARSVLSLNASPKPGVLRPCTCDRVHTHAAAALVNFCSHAKKEMITAHLDDIIKGLLLMLNSSSKAWVQHQALTTLGMVAYASQASFRKVRSIPRELFGFNSNPNPFVPSFTPLSSRSSKSSSATLLGPIRRCYGAEPWNVEG